MKRFIGILLAVFISVSVYAQSKAEILLDKTFDLISNQLDTLTDMSDLSYDFSDLTETEVTNYVTKERVVKDMAAMWWKLFEEDNCITLMPETFDNNTFDYSGDKVYIVFSDEMFDSPRYSDTIALYITLKDNKPTKGDGVFPVIFLRESILELDEYTYKEYMKPVLAHELLHYACAVYDDFGPERGHDNMFANCCKSWSAALDMEIKVKATAYECDLLIK